MKYLLDTHAFIWRDNNPAKLSMKVRTICIDRANELLLSIACVWEMQIKMQLGKLTLPSPLANMITAQQAANAVQLLPVELPHVLELSSLPDHHKDPFDRLLISQARIERAQLISDDPQIAKYPVTVVW